MSGINLSHDLTVDPDKVAAVGEKTCIPDRCKRRAVANGWESVRQSTHFAARVSADGPAGGVCVKRATRPPSAGRGGRDAPMEVGEGGLVATEHDVGLRP